MAEKKYAVWPGHVTSETDGDVHYITARQLMSLYGVSPRECVVMKGHRGLGLNGTDLIDLVPRHDGDYSLPGDPTTEEGGDE